MWSVIFCALSAVISVFASGTAYFAVRHAKAVAASPLAKLHSVQSAVESLENSLSETQATLALVANKVKMQKVRNAAAHVRNADGSEPDPVNEPDAWRAWKNKQLRSHG